MNSQSQTNFNTSDPIMHNGSTRRRKEQKNYLKK